MTTEKYTLYIACYRTYMLMCGFCIYLWINNRGLLLSRMLWLATTASVKRRLELREASLGHAKVGFYGYSPAICIHTSTNKAAQAPIDTKRVVVRWVSQLPFFTFPMLTAYIAFYPYP